MARKTHMTESEFKAFTDDAMAVAKGTKGPQATLMDVLRTHGLEPNLPPAMADKLGPMLNAKIGQLASIDHNCSWCGTCSLCSACGELNAAAIGAASAAALHIID